VCTAIDEMRKESWEEGLARGSRKTLLSNIENVMGAFGVTLERAMDALQVDPAQRESLSRELGHRSGTPGTSQ